MPFHFEETKIPGVLRFEPRLFEDARGFFLELYKRSAFEQAGIPDFVQTNHSRSRKGTLRGLHFQRKPRAQGKLIRVVRGRVFDVAVDLREDSPSFGQWEAFELSDTRPTMVYIPPGCAHGFCAVSEEADLLYATTEEYAPELEAGVIWNDPDIGIDWPVDEPLLSAKDAGLPRLRDVSPVSFRA